MASVTLCAAWLIWFSLASHRLRVKLAELSARGEPISYAELGFYPIPDRKNAAIIYKKAISLISPTAVSPGSSNLTFPDHPPYGATWQAMVDQCVAADQPALALGRQARSLNRADWGMAPQQYSPSQWRTTGRSFIGERLLAEVLGDGALQAHSHGNDAEALERILDLFHFADLLQQRTFLYGRLVAIGFRAVATVRLQAIATQIEVAPNRERMAQVIHVLLSDANDAQARMETARCQNVAVLEEIGSRAKRSILLRPMFYLSEARVADDAPRLENCAAQSSWPMVMRRYPYPSWVFAPPAVPRPPPRFSHSVDELVAAEQTRYMLTEFRCESQMRMAAVSLALQAYRFDHQHWPVNLRELIPVYLPNVPDDPFYSQPHPIGYVIAAGNRPLLFIDTTGSAGSATPPLRPMFGWNNNMGSRQWLDVSDWWMPRPPR